MDAMNKVINEENRALQKSIQLDKENKKGKSLETRIIEQTIVNLTAKRDVVDESITSLKNYKEAETEVSAAVSKTTGTIGAVKEAIKAKTEALDSLVYG